MIESTSFWHASCSEMEAPLVSAPCASEFGHSEILGLFQVDDLKPVRC